MEERKSKQKTGYKNYPVDDETYEVLVTQTLKIQNLCGKTVPRQKVIATLVKLLDDPKIIKKVAENIKNGK